ncbi:McrC family protein [Umezakia ovalisporum]|uniref:McrC family protein n=1 Tax=Umezakia ovalisporum FSS-43 TaxID=2740520 RepID=A0ABT6JZU2_9CYAN|nr:restriction endonuclease [Umezakia ovalisporum]MDH6055608.1 McrC family protein [Umezakia ovalisporum FSS-43]MDH6071317.1 McrC family protein [Umezakia ovalisporum CobakiLakeA]MDH6072779.1 McrC family protein [Umezakia ovalisporum CS-1034]MDH6080596.1 McrC family protein [Umezakia ovalisporum FSS-44]MDH6095366.1 McrC family protein [Umezakia ovalisporum CobakiLakeB]
MLEYVYQLKNFRILEGLMDCESLEGFYKNLANILAQKILERCHKGLYRAYLPKTDQLTNIRGKLDIRQAIEKPWMIKRKCHYEEHTVDITENQILIYTLYIISHSSLCSENVSITVVKAYHALQALVSLQPYKPEDCIGRIYHSLNEDYQILHHICYFFLENTSPSHKQGKNATLPFLVNMHTLYELFVAEWLKVNLPPHLSLKSQETINKRKNLYFKIDLVIYEKLTLIPRYILDTKYKAPKNPSSQDIAQVVTYAVCKSCQETVLIYPTPVTCSVDEFFGSIRVRSLTFSLDQNLDITGEILLKKLFSC